MIKSTPTTIAPLSLHLSISSPPNSCSGFSSVKIWVGCSIFFSVKERRKQKQKQKQKGKREDKNHVCFWFIGKDGIKVTIREGCPSSQMNNSLETPEKKKKKKKRKEKNEKRLKNTKQKQKQKEKKKKKLT